MAEPSGFPSYDDHAVSTHTGESRVRRSESVQGTTVPRAVWRLDRLLRKD